MYLEELLKMLLNSHTQAIRHFIKEFNALKAHYIGC